MFGDLFKEKKVIVTGNSGFKGSWLSIWLKKLGASVHGISYLAPSYPNMFESLSLENKLDSFYKVDISDNSPKLDDISLSFEDITSPNCVGARVFSLYSTGIPPPISINSILIDS